MTTKQIRAAIPSNAYFSDKENVNPLQDFSTRKGNGVLHQKCRSPLPAGFPRAPLQDITAVINPIKVFYDSPRRSISKRAKSETQGSESVKLYGNSSKRRIARLSFASDDDCAEELHCPVSNSAETGDLKASIAEEAEEGSNSKLCLSEMESKHEFVLGSFEKVGNSSFDLVSSEKEPVRSHDLDSSEIKAGHENDLVSLVSETGHVSVLGSSRKAHITDLGLSEDNSKLTISLSAQKHKMRSHSKLSMAALSRPSMKSTQRSCKHTTNHTSSILKFR